MKNKTISEQGYINKSISLQTLKLTKISLLIFLLGICVVGRRESTWPIVFWILYSGYSARFRPPLPSISTIELRAYSATGELYIVKEKNSHYCNYIDGFIVCKIR